MFAVLFLHFLVSGDVWAENAVPESQSAIDRSVPYRTFEGGKQLLADIYCPQKPGPHPTLLMIHGGAWFAGNKAHVAYHAKFAAQNGFAVVAINYRLAPKYKFPAQLEDCQAALKWIAKHSKKYEFDIDRVGVYGYSAGAQLACLIGVSQESNDVTHLSPSPKIRAIVAGGTPCEFAWISRDSKALAYWLGGSRAEQPDVYAAASPVSHVDAKDPPVFLFHGTADRIVPLESSRKMKQSLDTSGVACELYLVQDGSHFGAFIDQAARQKALGFLTQRLGSIKSESRE